MNTNNIAKTLELIIQLLSRQQYDELFALDVEKHLPAEDMPEFIKEYGGVITIPEDGRYDYDFYPVEGTDSVCIDYNIVIDGVRSHLTLQCKLTDKLDGSDTYDFSIESIRVL